VITSNPLSLQVFVVAIIFSEGASEYAYTLFLVFDFHFHHRQHWIPVFPFFLGLHWDRLAF